MLVSDAPIKELTTKPQPKREDAGVLPRDSDSFARRHIGPNEQETAAMLQTVGFPTLEALVDEAIPSQIRLRQPLRLPEGKHEQEALASLRQIASQNQVFRSYIGMGYYDCFTPAVIQRNLLENPGWYTQYTP